MKNNKNESRNKISKTTFFIGLLIEIFVFLIGVLLIAIFIEIGFKYLGYVLFGIISIYFIGRNYFFLSFSSAILGICWKKNKFIILKNCLYILIIFLVLQKIIVLKILSAIAINGDMVFMFLKGNWILNQCFKIESQKKR